MPELLPQPPPLVTTQAPTLDGRLPVHAGDPPEVFIEEANLLAFYSELIARDVRKINAQCSTDAELHVAAAAYIAEIGSNIPDPIIHAAVRRLAVLKFRTIQRATV
jgi:hypothetical protein